jgi:hypothetical protein
MSVSGSVSPLSGTSQSVLPATTIMRCIAWCVTAPARPGLSSCAAGLLTEGAARLHTERLDTCGSREWWHACGTEYAKGCHRGGGHAHKLEREHGGLPEYTTRSQRKDVRSKRHRSASVWMAFLPRRVQQGS